MVESSTRDAHGLHEMPDDDAPKSQVLPPLGDHRPTRADDAPLDSGKTTVPLELSPSPARDEAGSAAVAPVALPAADPESAPALPARRPARRMASLSAACGAHVLVLLALVSPPPVEFGRGGTARDAISVSIVPASAIEARQVQADAAAQAAPSQLSPQAGEDSTSGEASSEKTTPEQKVERPLSDPTTAESGIAAPQELALESAPEQAPEITSPIKPPEETKLAAAEQPEKPVEDNTPREEAPTPPAPAAPAAGGATAHGAAPEQPPQPAAAAASPGEIHAYGTAVQMALLAVDQREAKARASASKAKGTVVVRLSLDAAGGLVSAEVVTSSGRAELDEAALLLIRLASFPPPPASLDATQRSYIAPIRFQ